MPKRTAYFNPTDGETIQTTSFYKTKQWRRCRSAFLSSKLYVCERCGGAASIAHHKQYLTPANMSDPYIALGWENLEAVCQECHNREHTATDATAPGISFDVNGNPVQKQ